MRLKRFSKNKKRDTMIIIAVVIVVGLVVSTNLIRSHAYFKTTKSFNVIQGKIPNKNNGDVTLAVKLDGEKYKGEGFPSKEGHKFKGYECTNGVELTWKPDTWKALIETDKPTVCILEFETKTEYEEEILKGSYPVIKDGLVPVTIANDGTVTKANTKDEWYSYENSKWANAVILVNNPSKTYNDGDPILEKDIESYFVWIPKYRYKLFNVEGNEIPAQEIEVEIGDYNTVNSDTECVATNKSGDIGTCKNEMWMTHPSFTSLGVNGIWVGKFLTTGTLDKITIKPNESFNISLSNAYNTSFNYKRGLDSHMMKNTEWGAVAYLTNSKYGRRNTEVWINNNGEISGCVGSSVSVWQSSSCANRYGSGGENVHGSTTDNISGIYDISGGSWKTVMGVLDGLESFGELTVSNIPNRYIDKYIGTDASINKILGDATGETKGWNEDYHEFPTNSSRPILVRGGQFNLGTMSGLFAYHNVPVNGARYPIIVLSPTN